MTKTRYRFIFIATFVAISVLFICLRLKTLSHLLVWDEAWDILTLRAFLANAKADPFYFYYFFHPPLYMFFAGLLQPFRAGIDVRLELLSLFFSYATFVVTYLLCRKIGGVRFGLLSILFLTLMPFSMAYDTWIKSDGLSAALSYLAIIFFLNRRLLWCAIALSFSLLAKENALFFIMSISFLMFIFREKKTVQKLLFIYFIIAALTAWWYLYFSALKQSFMTLYFSVIKGHPACQHAYLYHLQKLVVDMGIPLLVLLVIGLCYSTYLIVYKKQRLWLIPIVVTVSVYGITAFMTLKEPWFCLSARPALAMISAVGALCLLRISKRVRLSLLFLILLVTSVIYQGLFFSYENYHAKVYPHGWPISIAGKRLAVYLNQHMKDDDRALINKRWALNTIFIYYWKSHPIEIFTGKETVENIVNDIKKNKISWLVDSNSLDPQCEPGHLMAEVKGIIDKDPDAAGWADVLNTEKLWSEVSK